MFDVGGEGARGSRMECFLRYVRGLTTCMLSHMCGALSCDTNDVSMVRQMLRSLCNSTYV